MTECERIIAQGILPKSFFEEEVRCDFLITTEQKKIWAIELDLLLEFDRVCKKHNICYFLTGGTLLGAVRHRGFIPWDDDIDIEMKRKDYEKLLAVSYEFAPPYFLQTPLTDRNSAFSHIKIRNSNTTGVSEYFLYQKMNNGIFIDVMPLDNWVEDDQESFNQIRELNIENGTFMRLRHPNLDEKNRKRVQSWKGEDPLAVYEKIQALSQQYNCVDTDYLMVSCTTLYDYKRKLKRKEDYSDSVTMTFEGFDFPVPVGYQRVLSTLYGDYMKLPPSEKRVLWHKEVYFDADNSYSTFQSRYLGGDNANNTLGR